MLEQTGCDAVMIGRASRGNPWIFRECEYLYETGLTPPPPTLAEKLGLILEHLELHTQKEGVGNPVVQMRKFLGWYVRGLPHSTVFRDRVFKVEQLEEMERLIREYFEHATEMGYVS
jgi:tRNA-dihydrouridine synthase B